MSDDMRESKIDINELLSKYLSDSADLPEQETPSDDTEKKAPRPRRRMAARRAPDAVGTDHKPEETEADSGIVYGDAEGSVSEAPFVSDEESAAVPDPFVSDEESVAVPDPFAMGEESSDTQDPFARGEESSAALGTDENVEDSSGVQNAESDVQPEEAHYEPDAGIFAQYENDKEESYDYIAEEERSAESETTADEDAEADSGISDDAGADGIYEDDDSSYELGGGAADDADDMDDFDMNILLGLGMEEELEKNVGTDRVSRFVEKQQSVHQKTEQLNRERAALAYEYTTKTQTREVAARYSSGCRTARLKLVAAVVLTFVLFIFECHSTLGIELGGAFDPVVYPVVYIMVGLQLMVIVAALAFTPLISGMRSFFSGKPTPECVAGFAVIIDIIYSAVISFCGPFSDPGPQTYNLPVAVGLLFLCVYEWLNVRRERYSFGVISSNKKKYALASLSMAESHLEHEAFSDLMEEGDSAEDINVLKIEGADFVGDYFLRTNRYPGGRKFIGFIIPAILVVAAAFFAYKFNASGSLYEGLGAVAAVSLTFLPVSVFYMFSHPFFRAVSRAREEECTIVGESSVEEYADAAIIAFDDKNVFPSTGVNVRGINVFGNNRIDQVLYTAASVFCTLGGPLSDVFDIATRDIGHSDDVTLGRCLPGLLEVTVNGSSVMFGTLDALEEAGVRIPRPLAEHRNDEFGDTVCVMFMVENGRFVARMLIQYLVDPEFEFTLKQLERSGMFVGIKTFDPNVTEAFLGKQIKLKHYPVRIIRCKSLDDRTRVADTTVSGVVSADSPKPLLQTVTLCEKVLHARSVNTMLVIISLFVSLIVSLLSVLFGALTLSPLFIVIYQLFWIIPMYIVSRMIIS